MFNIQQNQAGMRRRYGGWRLYTVRCREVIANASCGVVTFADASQLDSPRIDRRPRSHAEVRYHSPPYHSLPVVANLSHSTAVYRPATAPFRSRQPAPTSAILYDAAKRLTVTGRDRTFAAINRITSIRLLVRVSDSWVRVRLLRTKLRLSLG